VALVQELIASQGLPLVHAYMAHIQAAAEGSVRGMLRAYCASASGDGAAPPPPTLTLRATDHMDDGTPLQLRIVIDSASGDALFDFEGTGAEVVGNTNAPLAVTYSAVIYCLRCMVGTDIPLNQGALAPVTIRVPEGCILRPSPASAVVGGNVLTSQRVVDVILMAFGVCGASSGCMNNLTYGNHSFGFYETICGGAGAGPGWHGASGVHTHMTNVSARARAFPCFLAQQQWLPLSPARRHAPLTPHPPPHTLPPLPPSSRRRASLTQRRWSAATQ
jgi:5-oxoprolinase (ATP-hydrolysing)